MQQDLLKKLSKHLSYYKSPNALNDYYTPEEEEIVKRLQANGYENYKIRIFIRYWNSDPFPEELLNKHRRLLDNMSRVFKENQIIS